MRHDVLLVTSTLLLSCASDPAGTTADASESGGTSAATGDTGATSGTTDTTGASGIAAPTTTGGEAGSGDMSEGTASSADASSGDGESDSGGESSSTGGPTQDLVAVAHTREFRGTWVATVSNINFPASQGLSAQEQQDDLRAMFDAIAAAGLNAVVLQVRPESDALYASAIEPWSRYLTGTQGEDPGYDPLEFAVSEAHLRGLELHAWFNPYRAKASAGSKAAANHISKTLAEYAYTYGNFVWMDPGAQPVQDQLVDVIADVVTRYDIDGVHFDDYFYPYPNGDAFPDQSTYMAYMAGGGQLGLKDWRRDNVNRMVERVGAAVAELRPSVRFGISPFGIYRPGIPPGINGLDQYDAIYSDPLRWMEEGWLDYLAPQLYWPSTQKAQAYGVLIEWWTSIATGGRYIFAGNYLSKLGDGDAWTIDEFVTQVDLSRELHAEGSQGNIWYNVAPILGNKQGVADLFKDEIYATPALTPPIAALVGDVVAPPWVEVADASAPVTHDDPASLRAWVVYRDEGGGWILDRVVAPLEPSVALTPGTWAISAVARSGVESLGVRVTVP